MTEKKVSIVGVGNVGSTLAFTLATKAICSRIVLKDIRENYVKAMALDISQAANASNSHTVVQAVCSAKDMFNSDIVVITAGIPRKPGMSRNDLLSTNAKIMEEVIIDIKENCPNAIVIVVSNPLDAMVYAALKFSNFKSNQIIGMAGILDSARMSHFIFEKLGYGAGQIESSVMGGHGDDMVPLPNHSNVAGVCIEDLLSKEDIEDIVNKTKNGGLEIVKLLEVGSAYYAPSYATSIMIEAILFNQRKIFPCAVMLEGEYGFNNIVSGVPVMLGANGVEKIIELELTNEQKNQFEKSVSSVNSLTSLLDKEFFTV